MSEILLARAGEEILCPECMATLATYHADWTADLLFKPGGNNSVVTVHPPAFMAWTSPSREGKALWCGCGGAPTRPLGRGPLMRESEGPCIFLRSGSWVGWRGLGE